MPQRHRHKGAVTRLAWLAFLVGLADFVFGAVYVTLMLEAGLDPKRLGVGFFLMMAIATVVEIFSGDLGDRWGHRKLACYGLTLWGLALVLFVYAETMPLLMLGALTVWSIGQALYSGAPLSLTINAIPQQAVTWRDHAVRWHSIAGWIGRSCGGAVVFFGVWVFDFRQLVGGAGVILVTLAVWLALRWPESEKHATTSTFTGFLGRAATGWNRTVTVALCVSMIAAGLLSVILFAWQPMLNEVAGIGVEINGLSLLLMTICAALGAWGSNWKLSASRLGLVLVVGLCAVSLSFVAFGVYPGAVTAIVAVLLTEVVISFCLTTTVIIAHQNFADEHRNLQWSIFSAAIGMAMAVTDLIFGPVWSAYGMSAAVMYVGCGFFLAVVVLAAVLVHRNGSLV
ncbi:MAG: MFS transporter [Corynebacterium sp.]|uniref:MFS transporter n=1 Tax=Corynebacterium sp. TaxID=1720 RepID=UPI0026DC1169|nr:MFS transporter [Corynebacterium sp.]MDO5098849.1 MFS transporter [Corynebacterium sp.]